MNAPAKKVGVATGVPRVWAK